jgi:hypothetical protein
MVYRGHGQPTVRVSVSDGALLQTNRGAPHEILRRNAQVGDAPLILLVRRSARRLLPRAAAPSIIMSRTPPPSRRASNAEPLLSPSRGGSRSQSRSQPRGISQKSRGRNSRSNSKQPQSKLTPSKLFAPLSWVAQQFHVGDLPGRHRAARLQATRDRAQSQEDVPSDSMVGSLNDSDVYTSAPVSWRPPRVQRSLTADQVALGAPGAAAAAAKPWEHLARAQTGAHLKTINSSPVSSSASAGHVGDGLSHYDPSDLYEGESEELPGQAVGPVRFCASALLRRPRPR